MPEKQFKKGDLVQFQFVNRLIKGIVKEDRGPIGMKGRHLYLIEFKEGLDDLSQIELPAVDLELVSSTVSQ